MPTNTFSPATINKAKDILLAEGIIYKNYGVDGEVIIGATKGGSQLLIDWQKDDIEFDGNNGSTKGLRRTNKCIAKLVVNFLKINYNVLNYGINTTVSDGSDEVGTYKKTTFDSGFDSTDVLTNIAFVGNKANGNYCHIILENALNIDNIGFEFKEKNIVVGAMTYTGFYTYLAPTTVPLKIREEIPT